MRIDTEALFAGLGIQLFSGSLLILPLGVLGTVLDLFFQIPLSAWLFWGTSTTVLLCSGVAGAGVVHYARHSVLRTSLAFGLCTSGVWGYYFTIRYGHQQGLIFLLLLIISSLVGAYLMSKKKSMAAVRIDMLVGSGTDRMSAS
jgi:hypothetical protein